MDPVTEHELLTPYDIYLFKEGKHLKLHEKLGSHPTQLDGQDGTHFAVWAPNAKHVSVIGDFNEWRPGQHPLVQRRDDSGIWEGFIAGPTRGSLYKYHVESRAHLGYSMEKGDPFALHWEIPSRTASIVWDLKHSWNDSEWMKTRADKNSLNSPLAIYEMHLGSWKRVPEDNNRSLTYRETASDLPIYLEEMRFTHVEFLPIMEHPYSRSWGYQTLGYFAPTSRFGIPEDFLYHADGLRVDAVASMIYLDYSRKKGEWTPNQYGGRENLEALSFIRDLNQAVYRAHSDVQMIAEESTAWPMVSRPIYLGGLGFGMKWNMGWMHDTLEYMTKDPVYRKHHHNQLTFSLWYAFAENFVLPLS